MKPKAKVYIDGANMFYTQKKLGWFIDWQKMKKYLKEKQDILGIRYYTGIKPADKIILFSGDSDFQYLVKKLKDLSKKVIVFSSRRTISWEVKLEASEYIYLEDIKKEIKRE